MTLIALAGRAGSGKNEVAKALAAVRHVREFSFAAPLKEFCERVFGFTHDQLYGPSSERNKPDPRWPHGDCPKCYGGGWDCEEFAPCVPCGGKGIAYLTPRHALQTLGTEWGRACSENVWADLGVREAREWLFQQPTPETAEERARRGALKRQTRDPGPGAIAVITDCRFVNEARAVRAAGGEVWKIVRPGAGLEGSAGLHPSEAEQESRAFLELVTRTIENAGTREDLHRQVESVIA